jgi:hypothetical protein
MRKDFLTVIDFHKDRCEKVILHLIVLSVQPKLLHKISTAEENLLMNRICKGSLQAFEFLKTALLTISLICRKIREIYCNSDEMIMRQYLTNYHNPLHEEGGGEGKEGEGKGSKKERNGKRKKSRGRSKQRSKRRGNNSDAEEEEETHPLSPSARPLSPSKYMLFYSRDDMRNSHSKSPGRDTKGERPSTAPNKLRTSLSPSSKKTSAMREFSPKRKKHEDYEDDFQTLPFKNDGGNETHNNSYYSDFDGGGNSIDENEKSILEEDEAGEGGRGNHISQPRKGSAESQSIADENENRQERRSDPRLPPKGNKNNSQEKVNSSYSMSSEDEIHTQNDQSIQEMPSGSLTQQKSTASLYSNDFEEKEASVRQDKDERKSQRKNGNEEQKHTIKKKSKKPLAMIITKKDLLIAQMKDTKLNENLLIQEIIEDEILRPLAAANAVTPGVVDEAAFYGEDYAYGMKGASLSSFSPSHSQEKEEKDGFTRQGTTIKKSSKKKKKGAASPQRNGMIQCSYCFDWIPKYQSKSFPQILNSSDTEVIQQANQCLSSHLHSNLEMLKVKVQQQEYSSLYLKLMKKLKFSVEKSSRRYSYVKTNSENHLSSSIFEDEDDEEEMEQKRKEKEKRKVPLTNNNGKYSSHPAPHHDAIFCSYECMKRWTVFYCPIQYKYESEILIDMVAGYSVRV